MLLCVTAWPAAHPDCHVRYPTPWGHGFPGKSWVPSRGHRFPGTRAHGSPAGAMGRPPMSGGHGSSPGVMDLPPVPGSHGSPSWAMAPQHGVMSPCRGPWVPAEGHESPRDSGSPHGTISPQGPVGPHQGHGSPPGTMGPLQWVNPRDHGSTPVPIGAQLWISPRDCISTQAIVGHSWFPRRSVWVPWLTGSCQPKQAWLHGPAHFGAH